MSRQAGVAETVVCCAPLTRDPLISHHLKVVRAAGLIDGERRGTWIYYRAQPEALRALSEALLPGSVLT